MQCAAADKISTDKVRRAVPLRQLSFRFRRYLTTQSHRLDDCHITRASKLQLRYFTARRGAILSFRLCVTRVECVVLTTPSLATVIHGSACNRVKTNSVGYRPNSITLASSELAPNMFGASSELVRSWFEAESWPIIQLASSELARASRFAAKFHYVS